MSATELLATLRADGFLLEANGDHLRVDAPADALTPEVQERLRTCKPTLLALLATEQAWAVVEQIASAGSAKAAAALALDATGAHEEAERLRAEVKGSVLEDWLPAMRRWACAADRAGELPAADRWLLEDADAAAANGYRPVPGGWIETEARARCCVRHADRPLLEGDKLYCIECRAEADPAHGPETRAALPASETLIVDPVERPGRPCFSCYQDAWRKRPSERGGGWLCGACHPPLDGAAESNDGPDGAGEILSAATRVLGAAESNTDAEEERPW